MIATRFDPSFRSANSDWKERHLNGIPGWSRQDAVLRLTDGQGAGDTAETAKVRHSDSSRDSNPHAESAKRAAAGGANGLTARGAGACPDCQLRDPRPTNRALTGTESSILPTAARPSSVSWTIADFQRQHEGSPLERKDPRDLAKSALVLHRAAFGGLIADSHIVESLRSHGGVQPVRPASRGSLSEQLPDVKMDGQTLTNCGVRTRIRVSLIHRCALGRVVEPQLLGVPSPSVLENDDTERPCSNGVCTAGQGRRIFANPMACMRSMGSSSRLDQLRGTSGIPRTEQLEPTIPIRSSACPRIGSDAQLAAGTNPSGKSVDSGTHNLRWCGIFGQ